MSLMKLKHLSWHLSANAEFFYWQVSMDFEKVPSDSPHLRGRGKRGKHSCNIAKSCLCKPKAEPELWTRLYQRTGFSRKHPCFLVGSSPASSRFYEHALTNSFQSFPSITMFLRRGKFPSKWHLAWHHFSSWMWLLWQLLLVWQILILPVLCKHYSCISYILWEIKTFSCF